MKPEKDYMLWIQLTHPISAKKGDILRIRIDNIRQYQPGNFQWLVTPLGKESNKIKLKTVNPPPANERMTKND